jgi:hypothetical protein
MEERNRTNGGDEGSDFLTVFKDELEEIRRRRQKAKIDSPGGTHPENLKGNLVGLALSGGGIRSATFCLGLLQEFKRQKLLSIFDYLSTVSGGGYVGGWWSAWLSRPERNEQEKQKTKKDLNDKLFPDDEWTELKRADERRSLQFDKSHKSGTAASTDADNQATDSKSEGAESAGVDPIHHLRLFANYLTPRKGALSQDTWRAVAIITRNLLMTWMVLLPIIVGLVVAGQLYFVLHGHPARFFIFYPIKGNDSTLLEHFAEERWKNEVIADKAGWKDDLEPRLRRQMEKSPESKDLMSEAEMSDIRQQRNEAHRNYNQSGSASTENLHALEKAKSVWLRDFKEFTNQKAYHRRMLRRRLGVTAEPLIAIAGWIALLVITWLLLTLQLERARSCLIITASLVAVAAVVLCVLFVYHDQSRDLLDWLLNPRERLWRVVWLLAAAALWLVTWKPVRKRVPSRARTGSDTATPARPAPSRSKRLKQWLKSWQPWGGREAWRNRINSLHTRLLMWLVMIAVVLAIAGFGHEVLHYPYLDSPDEPKASLLFKVGVGVILVALAGLIFAAYKASPMGGGDKRQKGMPSIMSRAVFLALPWLVILLMAFAAAWVGHKAVAYMWELHLHHKAIPFIQYGQYAAFFGVAIALIFALFEMQWRPDRRMIWLALPLALPGLTLLIVLGKLCFRFFAGQVNPWLSILALIICGIGLFFILLDIRDKDKEARSRKTWKDIFKYSDLGALVVRTMIVVSYLIWFSYEVITPASGPNLPLDALKTFRFGIAWSLYADALLLAPTLAGACLLYRLLLVTDKDKEEPETRQFKLSLFPQGAKNERQARRFAVAICCFLAVAVSCALRAHNLALQKEVAARTTRSSAAPGVAHAETYGSLLAKSKQSPQASPDASAEENQTQDETEKSWIERWNVFERLLAGMEGKEYKVYWALPAATFFAACVILIFLRIRDTHRQSHTHQSLKPLIILFIPAAGASLLALWMMWEVLENFGKQPAPTPTPSGLLNSFTFAGIALCLAFTRFETKWGKGDNRRSLWLLFAAYLTLMGLLIHSQIPPGQDHFRYEYAFGVFALLVAVLTWLISFGWLANPNTFSMHNFYKWRLVRAYLGASNLQRYKADKNITEAAPADDLLLTKLENCRHGAPYHLISATLNLVAGRDLAIAQRSADSFLLSKHYCGSLRTDYRRTRDYMKGQLALGTAIAVSGAAASPNMGTRTPTSALAMLMTLMNVRLGYWVPTPNQEDWLSARPRLWPFYLIREFFSQTNDLSSFCYLSDGGHFDNTGIHALVMRGCRFIVAADCGADPQHSFNDLGDLIRLCRIDFGAQINLDIEGFLKREGGAGRQTIPKHFIVGEIKYSQEHLEHLNRKKLDADEYERTCLGKIIIFKPSLTCVDGADVRQYALENSAFPHTTTANQWFDESQFESYRRLGELCARSLFGKYEIATLCHDSGAPSARPGDELCMPFDVPWCDNPAIPFKSISGLFDQIYKDHKPSTEKLPASAAVI